jgi:hypothetical protein
MNGKDYVADVLVKSDAKMKRMYVHEVALREKLQQSVFKTGAIAAEAGKFTGTDAGAIRNVLQSIFAVNPETVSKVVDGNGEPLVMYHGGAKGLSEFNRTDRPDSAYKKGSLHSQGIWLAQLRGTEGGLSEDYISSEASTYALNQQDGGKIYDLFANIRNPKRMGQSDASYETASDLNGRGFDGAYMIDSGFWVAFNPNQIKSATDNNGEFSSNPSILYSSAEEDSAAIEQALNSMKPIHRAVFEAVNSGMTPEQVMAKYSISSKAVSNLLDHRL